MGILSENKKGKTQKGGGDLDGISLDVSQPDLSNIASPLDGPTTTIGDTMNAVTDSGGNSKMPMAVFVLSLIGFLVLVGIVCYKVYQRISYV